MVTVNLVNGYFVEQDDMSCTLKQSFSGKDKHGNKKLSVRLVGYYRKMPDCIEEVVKQSGLDEMDGMTLSLREYCDQLKRNDEEMKAYIKRFADAGGFSEKKKVFRIEE